MVKKRGMISLNEELHKEISQIAEQRRLSRGAIIQLFVEEYRQKKK